MGLTSSFVLRPSPIGRRVYVADDCPSAIVDVHMLNGDLLLSLPSVTVQRFQERGMRSAELVRLG